MVNGLHKAGIAVIMDVVYNHTAEGNEKGIPFLFKGLDNPGYYRLCDDKRFYWNGTGCGNEFRSENPMTRKYILDSLKYWMREYHVDGFRFDLGTILDKETMSAILDELPASAIIVAEPWAADWKRNQWGKSDFRNTKLGKWNDDFREQIRNFISGNGDRNSVMTVLAGTCFWWTAKPTESVNYIECHDGAALSDLLKMDKDRFRLGAVALLTAQGMPMIHEGQEFMRSKKGNDNSYDQDNEINWLNWNDKTKNADIYEFYKGLIGLRMKYENFRHPVALNSQNVEWLQPANNRGLGYLLKGRTDLLVLFNTDPAEWITFNLPGAEDWTVICDGEKVNDKGFYTAKGTYNVPSRKAIILKKAR
ncbi:MAG: Pullulanase precursor [bacterium ADurb.Bin374]|nr:MAG: Pullulanase precursor [bacterium ADurb.Bin374]